MHSSPREGRQSRGPEFYVEFFSLKEAVRCFQAHLLFMLAKGAERRGTAKQGMDVGGGEAGVVGARAMGAHCRVMQGETACMAAGKKATRLHFVWLCTCMHCFAGACSLPCCCMFSLSCLRMCAALGACSPGGQLLRSPTCIV